MITVFTPTYNREHLLPRLYDSLKKQTSKDFEWLIVDDGSVDNTESLVNSWMQQSNDFSIRYYKQENGGKHRAINRGVKEARGELFFIVDSDDWLPTDSIELIKRYYAIIDTETDFAGICGLKSYADEKTVGTTFDADYMDAFMYERKKYCITGDKAEVYITSILKQFPFPEIDGEKFCPEALVWNRISEAGYKLRYFNKNIYYCEYQEQGLSSNIDKHLTKSIKTYLMYVDDIVRSTYFSQQDKTSALCNAVRRARINNYSYKDICERYNISYINALMFNVIAKLVYATRRG